MNKLSLLLTSKKRILSLWYNYKPISEQLISNTSFQVFYQHPYVVNSWASSYQLNSQFHSSSSVANILTKLKTTLSSAISDKTKVPIAGCLTYEKCADEVDYAAFFKYFNLPDTFQSWFIVIQLHVWMCILITIDYKNGRHFRNSLVDAMWHDVEMRLDRLAVMKSSKKKKYLNELLSQFKAALFAYDEGILSEDPVLAAAVWRTVFKYELVDPELLEKMVLYIRKQINHLETINKESVILKGSVTFLPLESIFSTSEKNVY